MRALRVTLLALAAILPLLPGALPRAAANDAGFRRFADTLSPDGAYLLAWGHGCDETQPVKGTEWKAGSDTFEDSEFAENYLVDARRGRVLAVIPDHDHWVRSDGSFKPFSGLSVGWSEDSRRALAIYEGRWSDESILWINPEKRTFVEVAPVLHETYARFLKHKLEVGDPGGISFSHPALLPGKVLVIHARARPKVNEPLEYRHRLTLRVNFDGPEPRCALLDARRNQ